MPPRFVELPEMSLWSQSIGGFILNFGMAEFLTLRCVELLCGEKEAISIRNQKLSMRITSAKKAIEGSVMASEQKERALFLWSEIASLSKLRNRIAHNPLAVGWHAKTGQLVFSVVDLKRMTPNGKNQLDTLAYQEIAGAAIRISDMVQELSQLIEPASDDLST
jgi:hypothetical protein